MKITTLFIALALLFTIPAVSLAASYHFVNLNGDVMTVEADTPADALAIVNSWTDTIHSGVALDLGIIDEDESHGVVYQYVDILGNTRTVTAATVDAARVLATDEDPQSGFIVIDTAE